MPTQSQPTARTKHTPTPWAVSSSVMVIAPQDKRACPVICNTMDLGGLSEFNIQEAAANAAHIVHCVNTHDALVAENQQLRAALERSTVLLHRAAQHVPVNAVNAKEALRRPVAECRTLDKIIEQIAENRAALAKEDL